MARGDNLRSFYLNGHSCLGCGRGHYHGYAGALTRPCGACGHQAPARMRDWQWRAAIAARDAASATTGESDAA